MHTPEVQSKRMEELVLTESAFEQRIVIAADIPQVPLSPHVSSSLETSSQSHRLVLAVRLAMSFQCPSSPSLTPTANSLA